MLSRFAWFEFSLGLRPEQSEARKRGLQATINAKNFHDRYVGLKTYTFLFRGEKIVDARLPLPGEVR